MDSWSLLGSSGGWGGGDRTKRGVGFFYLRGRETGVFIPPLLSPVG